MQPGERQLLHCQKRRRSLRQPQFAIDAQQAEIFGAGRRIQAKAHLLAAGRGHAHAAGVVAIEHLYALAPEYARLGPRVRIHTVVAVEMIFAEIEHRGRSGIQRARGFELKAGELQHPHFGPVPNIFAMHQRIQHCRADIASHFGRQAAAPAHRAGKGGHRGLAVGAGDGEHLRLRARRRRLDRMVARAARAVVTGAQCLREQFDIADHRHALRRSRAHLWRRQRHARADGDQIDTGKGYVAIAAQDQFRLRHFRAERRQSRRIVTGVCDAHARAAAG